MASILATLQTDRREPGAWPPGLEMAAFCFCVANLALVLSLSVSHLLAPSQIPTDFIGFWPAGRLVLDGQAAAVYDPVLHKAASVAVLGHDFRGNFMLHYPPHYLLLLAALPLLPYGVSYLVWVILTFVAYVFVVSRIIGGRGAILLACACPALVGNAFIGQNGCITAALFGGALLTMQRRPIVSGCLIALLTYKPQFGILIPLALICAGLWRVFFAAAIGTALLAGASWMILGTGVWEAFIHAILSVSQETLNEGRSGWSKIQNLFAFVRMMGGSEQLAWIIQGIAIAVSAVWVGVAWTGRQPFAIKAAILSVAAVICAPYIFIYDLILLAVPVAFLLRDGRTRGFLPGEMAWLGVACLLIASFPFVNFPIGVGAVLIVAGLIARRMFAERLKLRAPCDALPGTAAAQAAR